MSAETNDFADHIKELASDYERMYKAGFDQGYKMGFKAATDKALELVNKAFPSKVQV